MPSVTADRSKSRLATPLSFAAAGFGVACWAPVVPFAKARLRIGDADLRVCGTSVKNQKFFPCNGQPQ